MHGVGGDHRAPSASQVPARSCRCGAADVVAPLARCGQSLRVAEPTGVRYGRAFLAEWSPDWLVTRTTSEGTWRVPLGKHAVYHIDVVADLDNADETARDTQPLARSSHWNTIRYLAECTSLDTATLSIDSENARSLAVARRTGFRISEPHSAQLYFKRPV